MNTTQNVFTTEDNTTTQAGSLFEDVTNGYYRTIYMLQQKTGSTFIEKEVRQDSTLQDGLVRNGKENNMSNQ